MFLKRKIQGKLTTFVRILGEGGLLVKGETGTGRNYRLFLS